MRVGMSALILEDNTQMQFLLTEILRGLRVSKITATSTVSKAKDRCKKGGYGFALVDVGLGDEDGLDFVRHVRSDVSHPAHKMPMIVVSGQGNRATIESARDAGANWFMVKPIKTADLVDRLNRMFAEPVPPLRPKEVVWSRNDDTKHDID